MSPNPYPWTSHPISPIPLSQCFAIPVIPMQLQPQLSHLLHQNPVQNFSAITLVQTPPVFGLLKPTQKPHLPSCQPKPVPKHHWPKVITSANSISNANLLLPKNLHMLFSNLLNTITSHLKLASHQTCHTETLYHKPQYHHPADSLPSYM